MSNIRSFAIKIFIFTFSIASIDAATIIHGNIDSSEHSFSFKVDAHAFFSIHGRLFVDASLEGANEFSIAGAGRFEKKFRALTPQKVSLNGQENNNPLYNSVIEKIVSFGPNLVATKQNDPASIYFVDDFKSPVDVVSAHNVGDSNGIATKKIFALAAQNEQNIDTKISGLSKSFGLFMAVSNQSGTFDGAGSGIAYAFLDIKNENSVETRSWQLVDAEIGSNGNRAAAISKDTDAIKIGSSLTSIGQIVDLHWDATLQRIYVAVQTQAGAAATDGTKGVLVGSITNGKITFQSIASDAVFDSTDKVVGALGALTFSSIFKVRTLYTTTHLKYLVVAGDSKDPSVSKNVVYALPLVDSASSVFHGTLANVNSIPVTDFVGTSPFRFLSRRFVENAQNPSEVFTQNSSAARVGGGNSLPGDINDIFVWKDAVYVSVINSSGSEHGGIYTSQALFDSYGRIKGWTQWVAAGFSSNGIGFAFDANNGNFWLLQGAAPTQNVLRTNWTTGETEFEKFVSATFKQSQIGVMGLFDFPYITSGFNQTVGSRVSLEIFTGYKKIMLLETGQDQSGVFNSTLNFSNLFNSNSGNLSSFNPGVSGLIISGGEIDNLGAIMASDIVFDGNNGWLAVGGFNGVAILAKSDGSGFNNLSSGFNGLSSDMSFIKVGNFNHVLKLMSLQNILFVLTTNGFYKVELSSNSIASRNFNITQITAAQSFGEKTSFADFVVSGPLALLATSRGLFRSGNGLDIRISSSVNWVSIDLPEGAGSFVNGISPATKLFVTGPTPFEKDIFSNNSGVSSLNTGGTVYILNTYVGYHEAQAYRLSITPGSQVNNDTAQLLPDMYVVNQKSFFVDFPTYRNYIVTDGAMFFASRSGYNGNRAFISLLPSYYRSAQGARDGSSDVEIPLNIPNSRTIGKIIRSSSSGSWLVGGDFGLRTNE